MIDDVQQQEQTAGESSTASDLNTYEEEDLGVTLGPDFCSLKVWAPYACKLELLLYVPLTG